MVKTRINTDNNSKNHNRNAVFCSKRRHSSYIRQHLKTIHKEKPLENICLNSFSSHTGVEDLGKLDTLFKTTRKIETLPVYIRSPATSEGSGLGQKRREEGSGRRVTPYDGVSFKECPPLPSPGPGGENRRKSIGPTGTRDRLWDVVRWRNAPGPGRERYRATLC